MNWRGPCLVLFLLTLLLMLDVWKSHRTLLPEAPVAFVRYTGVASFVRLEGDFRGAGIYKIPDGATVVSVINMAVPKVFSKVADDAVLSKKLSSGDIVALSRNGSQGAEITFRKMKAAEKILLGLPLCLNQMSFEEWLDVPGVGPGLATEIIAYRQIYGGFRSPDELEHVPGIGPKKVAELIKYFY